MLAERLSEFAAMEAELVQSQSESKWLELECLDKEKQLQVGASALGSAVSCRI